MFELTVFGINVLLPSLIVLLGLAITLRLTAAPGVLAGATQVSARDPMQEFLRACILCSATTLAIWAAVALRTQWAVWHEDAWMRMPTGVALVALAAAVTAGMKNVWVEWILRGAAVWIATQAMFPTGEAWEFLLDSQYYWMASMWLATVVGWFFIARRPSNLAAVLGLSWIGLLIAAAFLTSQSFLKVTEPLMAVASVLGCLSLFSLRSGAPRLLAAAAGPCLFAAAAAIASAQFNSFLGLPDALSWLAMLSPALAAVLTDWTCRGPATRGNFHKSVWVTLLVCLFLAAVIIAWTHWSLPVGGEEW